MVQMVSWEIQSLNCYLLPFTKPEKSLLLFPFPTRQKKNIIVNLKKITNKNDVGFPIKTTTPVYERKEKKNIGENQKLRILKPSFFFVCFLLSSFFFFQM